MVKKRRSSASQSVSQLPAETRTAEVATVAWMMCTVTALLCLVGSLFSVLLARLLGESVGIHLLGRLLILGGGVAALLGLSILPLVLRLRRQPPPRQVILVAGAICIIPVLGIATILFRW